MSEQKKTLNRWLVAGIILSLVTILATVFGINSSPVVLLDTAGVTEAAEQVGINDLKYFGKLFKRYAGVTPRTIKNNKL